MRSNFALLVLIPAAAVLFYAGRDLEEKDLVSAIKDTVPLSVTMAEKVEAIREWGRTRARAAG